MAERDVGHVFARFRFNAEAALARLRDRADGPFVVQLAREPNRRDSRWEQLFTGPVADVAPAPVHAHAAPAHAYAAPLGEREPEPAGPPEVVFPATCNDERLAKLETEVAALRAELDALKTRLGE